MPKTATIRVGKPRQQVEAELLEEVRARHEEFRSAEDGDRIAARDRFALALRAFNRYVLDGRVPDENGRIAPTHF